MENAKFIVPDLVVSGHVAAYISPGNGGKTTIFIHLCEGMVEDGYTVTYLNLDGNPGRPEASLRPRRAPWLQGDVARRL